LVEILHYTSNPCEGGCGAQTGPTFHCTGSCDAYATHNRNLFCGYHYTFTDYIQLTGTWSHNGVTGKISFNGSKSSGSSYKPPAGGC
jgi:hypothetical protein